jgi:phosphate transport system substrate-binding protein
MKLVARIVLAATVMSMMGSLSASAEELRIGAGAAPTENVLKPISEAFSMATGIKLVIIPNGPKNAMVGLEKGFLEAASAGLSKENWMELLKKEGVEVQDPASLQFTTIGRDKIVVFVNQANPVEKLTKEQLTDIFAGTTKNWKEVGGNNLPVSVVWGDLIPGTNTMFVKNIMNDKAPTPNVIKATTAEDVRNRVIANPSAIGIGPLAIIDRQVKALNTPEVARPILLATKGKPSANVQKLLNFIAGEGQKYIKK